MRHWSLYIDESGDFDGRAPAVVAGLLVAAPWSADQDRAIRRALAGAASCVRWPPHAWTLNNVANARRAHDAGELDPAPALRRALDRGDERAAKDTIDAARAALGEALASLPAAVGAPVLVVGAQARRDGAERPAAYGQVRADGYVEALAATFARVALLVRGAPCVVDCFVARRDVVVEPLGARAALSAPLVRQIADAAVGGIPGCADVRFVQHGIQPFALGTPGVVAADHVSNRLFGGLGAGQPRSWADILLLASDRVGLPVEATTPRGALPSLGAAGIAHERVMAAARGTPPAPAQPGWQHEQANAWVAVLP